MDATFSNGSLYLEPVFQSPSIFTRMNRTVNAIDAVPIMMSTTMKPPMNPGRRGPLVYDCAAGDKRASRNKVRPPTTNGSDTSTMNVDSEGTRNVALSARGGIRNEGKRRIYENTEMQVEMAEIAISVSRNPRVKMNWLNSPGTCGKKGIGFTGSIAVSN